MPLNWYMHNWKDTPTLQSRRGGEPGEFYRIVPHPIRLNSYVLTLQYGDGSAWGSLIDEKGRERTHGGQSYDGFGTVNEAMQAAEKSVKLRKGER